MYCLWCWCLFDCLVFFFFFKQKTAYEMRISDWSSDVCSSDLPLPQPLAAAAEARFGCEVREVFGSTETCIIARRRTALEDAWTPLQGVRVTPQPDGTPVHAGHLAQPVALADPVELGDNGRCGEGRLRLRGLLGDMPEFGRQPARHA